MANTYVKLTHPSVNGGNAVTIHCTTVVVTFNKKVDKKPNANYDSYPAIVQESGRENVKYLINSAKLGVGGLTETVLKQIVNLENDESSPLILNVLYGNDKTTVGIGSISVGSALLSVYDTDDTKIGFGEVIVVPGAGDNGGDLVSSVVSVNEFTRVINLANTAATSVALVPIKNNAGVKLSDSVSSTNDIPVTVDGNVTLTLDTTDSKDSYRPTVNISLVEVGTDV